MTDTQAPWSARGTVSAWQRFWFCSEPQASSLQAVRVGLSLIAAWYFASHWLDVGLWFSGPGVLATETLGQFFEAGDMVETAKWRLSPVYWLNSATALRAYLVIGILLAIAASTLNRTRVPAVLLWLWCVWLANRSLLISGPEELVLVFGLAYLAIASPIDPLHWSTAMARRLLQVHTAMWIAITGLTMLSSTIWWDGTGSIAVAAPTGRRLMDLTDILSNPWLHEPLTHALVMTAILAPIAIWFRPMRKPALVALLAWTLVVGMLTSQWMYLLTIAVLLQAFRFASAGPPESATDLGG